jgi:hypothetical protein
VPHQNHEKRPEKKLAEFFVGVGVFASTASCATKTMTYRSLCALNNNDRSDFESAEHSLVVVIDIIIHFLLLL